MDQTNLLILYVEKEDYVSKALLNRQEQGKIWNSIDRSIL